MKEKRRFTKKEKREIDKLVKMMDMPRWLAEDGVYIKRLGLDKIEPSRAAFYRAVDKCMNAIENLEKKLRKKAKKRK